MADIFSDPRDARRRLVNLIIFFYSRLEDVGQSQQGTTAQTPKLPITDIYEHVEGYRCSDSPWGGRDRRSSESNSPEWSRDAVTRLIVRDVKYLRKLGVPIREEVSQGKERLLWLEPEDSLSPISLTPQEATLLAILGRRGTDHELSMFVRNGWSKVGSKTRFHEDTSGFFFTHSEDVKNISVLATIDTAICTRKQLSFTYQSMPKATPKDRTLEPWALVTSEDRYYVVGFDLDAQEPRCFRCNHIHDLRVLDCDQEHRGTEEKVKKAFRDSMNRGSQVSVRYRSDYALGPDSTEVKNGAKEWQSPLMNRDRALRFFAAQAPQVEVLEPLDFRDDVVEFLQEFQRR